MINIFFWSLYLLCFPSFLFLPGEVEGGRIEPPSPYNPHFPPVCGGGIVGMDSNPEAQLSENAQSLFLVLKKN